MPLALELALDPLLAELARDPLPLFELAREDARDEARDPDLDLERERERDRPEPDLKVNSYVKRLDLKGLSAWIAEWLRSHPPKRIISRVRSVGQAFL